MVIVNIKKEDSKKAFKKEAVFKVPKIKGYPTIRIEKGCDFQRNTNFSYSSQPLFFSLSNSCTLHADYALSGIHNAPHICAQYQPSNKYRQLAMFHILYVIMEYQGFI